MCPSLPLSVLKSFMTTHGYRVEVKYWGGLFEDFQMKYFQKQAEQSIFHPFINYIWVHCGKKLDNCNWKYQLLSMNPYWYHLEFGHTENRMIQYANELEKIITDEILKMDLGRFNIFGITTKFYQWICGGIVAHKVKKLFPNIKIVIGGFGTSDEALAMMNNFEYYDFAIWGEGEYPLLNLCEAIESSSYTEVTNLIYRNKYGIPQVSKFKNKNYFDLNSNIFPDYSDFISQNASNKSNISLLFEGSRSCHWKKCRFCYLNDGYRYREKTTENKIKEFRYQIEKYKILNFICVDNDFIGKDIRKYEDFLDELINLKEEYNDFSIEMTEIITKNINGTIIKKMALGGISCVQIGYESPSDKLLQQIKKKNTFASNLLFIKWAKEFSITVKGINVIQGLLEETADNIFEATNNLFYLRFFLSNKVFSHFMNPLKIKRSSPYFQIIEKNKKLDDWSNCFLSKLLPDTYFDQKDKYCLFDYSNSNYDATLWAYFNKMEKHYINSKYNYQLINNKDIIHYREYLENELINELAFEDTLHWDILKSCNHSVISLNELSLILKTSYSNDILLAIYTLKNEGLLYYNEDFSEIVTIINTDIVL